MLILVTAQASAGRSLEGWGVGRSLHLTSLCQFPHTPAHCLRLLTLSGCPGKEKRKVGRQVFSDEPVIHGAGQVFSADFLSG